MSDEFFLSQLGFCARFSFMQVSSYAGGIFTSRIKEHGDFNKAVDETAVAIGDVWSNSFKELIRNEKEKL